MMLIHPQGQWGNVPPYEHVRASRQWAGRAYAAPAASPQDTIADRAVAARDVRPAISRNSGVTFGDSWDPRRNHQMQGNIITPSARGSGISLRDQCMNQSNGNAVSMNITPLTAQDSDMINPVYNSKNSYPAPVVLSRAVPGPSEVAEGLKRPRQARTYSEVQSQVASAVIKRSKTQDVK
jgi:hypothetical protein